MAVAREQLADQLLDFLAGQLARAQQQAAHRQGGQRFVLPDIAGTRQPVREAAGALALQLGNGCLFEWQQAHGEVLGGRANAVGRVTDDLDQRIQAVVAQLAEGLLQVQFALALQVVHAQAVGSQHRQRGVARGRAGQAQVDPLAAQLGDAAQRAVGAHQYMHRLRIEAGQGTQAEVRAVLREGPAAGDRQVRGIALRQGQHGIAGAQQAQVFDTACGGQRQDVQALLAQRLAHGPGEAGVLSGFRAAGQRVAVLQASQAPLDIGQRTFHLFIDHLARGSAGAAGREVEGGADGRYQRLARAAGVARLRRPRQAEALGRYGLPGAVAALVDQAAVGEQHIALAIAAALDAADAARPGAEGADQAGHTGRIPGAEVEVALDPQLGIEVHQQALLVGAGAGIAGRAAPRQRHQAQAVGGEGLFQALAQFGFQGLLLGAARAGGEQGEQDEQQHT